MTPRPVGVYLGVAPDRVCSRCADAWPATSAYWPTALRYGSMKLGSWCRACMNDYAKAHAAKRNGQR